MRVVLNFSAITTCCTLHNRRLRLRFNMSMTNAIICVLYAELHGYVDGYVRNKGSDGYITITQGHLEDGVVVGCDVWCNLW